MQARFKKQLLTEFTQNLNVQLTSLEFTFDRSSKPDWIFTAKGLENSHGFILLLPHSTDNSFTLEVAGSINNTYPWNLGAFGSVPAWGTLEYPEYEACQSPPFASFRLRLAELWPPHEEYWWNVSSNPIPDADDFEAVNKFIFGNSEESDTADTLISSVIHAVDKIQVFGVPYLQMFDLAVIKYGTRIEIE